MKLCKWQRRLVSSTLLIVGGGALIGLITGFFWPVLALTLAITSTYALYQISRLHHWLAHASHEQAPPEANGLWGQLFDEFYYMQRRTQRVRDALQAVIDRFQQSTAAQPDAMVMLDSNGTLQWWNPAAEQLLGLKEQDTGHPITNLVRLPSFKDYFQSQTFAEPLDMPSPVLNNCRLQVQITRYGQNEYLLIARDVSRLFHLEQMRKDFVANVSHELRTPLTVIKGYLETFTEYEDLVPQRWQRPITQMQLQTTRMQLLVNDLLLLAKLEATHRSLDTRPIDIHALLQRIIEDATALSGERAHHIELNVQPNLTLRGNEGELFSAFSNLVFNAVNYTPAGGFIQVSWSDKGFQVRDNGPGIEAKHLQRLTERFYRVDGGRSSQSGGTGLGLAIVKHVLLRHDAVLHIHSTVRVGSTFRCQFPTERLVKT